MGICPSCNREITYLEVDRLLNVRMIAYFTARADTDLALTEEEDRRGRTCLTEECLTAVYYCPACGSVVAKNNESDAYNILTGGKGEGERRQ